MNKKQLIGFVLALSAINWGLYGLFNLDLVYAVLGGVPLLAKLAYVLIGLVGVYKLYWLTTGGKK